MASRVPCLPALNVRGQRWVSPMTSRRPRDVHLCIVECLDDRAWIAQPFVAAMARAGVKIDTVVLDDRSAESEVNKAIDAAAHADVIIVSMYGRVRTGQARSVALPNPGTKALNALIEKKAPLIGISFGNPYILMGFPKLQTYMVAYGDMPSLQEAGAQAMLGQIDTRGRLPISLPGLYPRDAGIQLKAHAKS